MSCLPPRVVFRALAEHTGAFASHIAQLFTRSNRPAKAPIGTREGAYAPHQELNPSSHRPTTLIRYRNSSSTSAGLLTVRAISCHNNSP